MLLELAIAPHLVHCNVPIRVGRNVRSACGLFVRPKTPNAFSARIKETYMSVAGISASSFFAGLNSPAVQNKFQQIKKGFNSWARIFNPATCPRHKMIFLLCSNCSQTSSKSQGGQQPRVSKPG